MKASVSCRVPDTPASDEIREQRLTKPALSLPRERRTLAEGRKAPQPFEYGAHRSRPPLELR
jgi:hypothetical protein